jgi:hypothetical protein
MLLLGNPGKVNTCRQLYLNIPLPCLFIGISFSEDRNETTGTGSEPEYHEQYIQWYQGNRGAYVIYFR